MLMSSRGCGWGCDLVAPSVTDQGPQDVDAAAGEREESLDVAFALGALAIVKFSRVGVALNADQRGDVEDALQATVVSRRSVVVAADLAGVAWAGATPHEGREPVGRGKASRLPPTAVRNSAPRIVPMPGRDSITSASSWSRNRPSMSLSVSAIFSLRAITSLARVCTIFAMAFSPTTAVCWRSAASTTFSARAAALQTLRLRSQAVEAGAADRGRCLVSGQQHQRADVTEVEIPFQGREHAVQQGLEPVGGAGPVGDQIDAVVSQQPQLDRGFVAGADRLQIAAHPGLIGDHAGVTGVRLAPIPGSLGTEPIVKLFGEVEVRRAGLRVGRKSTKTPLAATRSPVGSVWHALASTTVR